MRPPKRGFGGMHSGTRYYARGANDRFSVYDAMGFRYANILVHGVEAQVTLGDFAVQEDIYPWQPGAEFRCSDEELNKIFHAGIRTVNLNARDAFTDCPTREQQAWVGAEPGKVEFDSPVPVRVELPGRAPVSLPAGKHTVGG